MTGTDEFMIAGWFLGDGAGDDGDVEEEIAVFVPGDLSSPFAFGNVGINGNMGKTAAPRFVDEVVNFGDANEVENGMTAQGEDVHALDDAVADAHGSIFQAKVAGLG